MKLAWPDARLDFLVLPGTQGVLEGNPDVNRILAFKQRAGWLEKIAQLARIWRRYDLAVAAIPNDRARIFACAASARTVGFTTDEETSWLKQLLLNVVVPFDYLNTHTVTMGLRLADALGIPAISHLQVPRVGTEKWSVRMGELDLPRAGKYAVVHPNPKFRYKMWDSAKWVTLISWLREQGLDVLLTGSGDPSEAAYVEDIAAKVPEGCRNLAGQLSLAETAELLKEACLFVGPDTAITHLAAATGIPTLALFGPSNPVKWGPWPKDWPNNIAPWPRVGSFQRSNVWLMQGSGDCVPCLLEGCDRNLDSSSRCLQEIDADNVIAAARALLNQTDVS